VFQTVYLHYKQVFLRYIRKLRPKLAKGYKPCRKALDPGLSWSRVELFGPTPCLMNWGSLHYSELVM
jgi:hypothetical protein